MSAKYKSPSFLLPNELNTSANTANDTGVNSLYSMDFDGTNYISAPNTFLNSTTAFSISFWGKLNSTSSNLVLGDFAPWSGASFKWVDISVLGGEGIQFVTAVGTNNYLWGLLNKDTDWHHFVVTYDAGTRFIYVDGSELATNTTGPSSLSSTFGNAFKIGHDGSGGANVTNGKIDEVAIFNRALTDGTGGTVNEIAALYDGSGSNIRPSNLMATNLNPIAYYPLGEQAQNSGKLPDTSTNEWQFPNGVLQDYVMDFDGNDEINLSPVQSLTNEFSISIWVKPDVLNNLQVILGNEVSDWIRLNSAGQITFRINGNNPSSENFNAISGNNLVSNAWQHLLFIRDSSDNIRIYRNGSLFSTNTYNQAAAFSIGKIGARTGVYYSGEMSNLAIWNSDQSTNIDNIYNNGSPQTSYTVTPQNWWKLNADSVYTPSAPNYTKALELNVSSNDKIDFTQGLLNNLSEFTVSFWYNRAAANNWPSYSVILTQSGLLDIGQFRYENNNAGIYVGLTTANGTFTIPSTSSGRVYLNEWLFVTVVYDGVNLISYRNGELAPGTNTVAATGNTVTNTNNFKLEPTHGLDYSVSNLAFYNTALTPSQVSTLFNFGTPETNISFSPQAWWKLDDQTAITDSSGNGHTGTNNGATDAPGGIAVTPSWKIPSALPITAPNYTTALNFNGNDYIDIAYDTSLNLGTKATWNMWVKWDDIAKIHCFASRWDSGQEAWYIQKPSSQNIEFNIKPLTGTYSYNSWPISGFSGVVDTWYNLCFVYDSSLASNADKLKFYVNGVPQTPSTTFGSFPSTLPVTTSKIRLAEFSAGFTGRYFEGSMSNFSLFNSALQPAQVSTLYNAGTPETAISFSPVSWWKLDTGGSTITDYGSGGNNGTNNGATQVTSDVLTTQPVNGVSTTLPSTALQQSDLQFDSPYSNYSLSFDGNDDYIEIPSGTLFDFGSNPFSFSGWFTRGNTAASNDVLFFNRKSTTTPNWQIRQNVNNIQIEFNVGGVWSNVVTTTNPIAMDTNWHHLVITKSGTSASIYIDGVAQATSGTAPGTIDAGDGTSFISSRNGGVPASQEWFGKIDETSIFNYSLSEAQVLEIYNNGRPKNLSTFSGTAPISWWRLGENAYFNNNSFVVPNSITGAPNGTGSGTITTMISADAPGTYANGIGTNLDILDRVGNAPLSTSNSQSYNMIPSDISPYVPGYVGNQIANNFSMSFDSASSDYIDCGNDNSLQFSSSFTISAWVNIDLNYTGNNAIISKDSNISNGAGYHIDFRSGNAVHAWAYQAGSKLIATGLTTNTWYHIVFIFESTGGSNGNQSLYINAGTPVTNTVTNFAASTIKNLRIGGSEVLSNYTNGKIDEVAIFDKALTADQIKFDLYQPSFPAGDNKTADIANNPNLPTPVAWYRMGD